MPRGERQRRSRRDILQEISEALVDSGDIQRTVDEHACAAATTLTLDTSAILPTMDEWKKQHDAEKIPNKIQSIHHTTFTPSVNRPFEGPRRKEDGDRTTLVFDDHSGQKPGWEMFSSRLWGKI